MTAPTESAVPLRAGRPADIGRCSRSLTGSGFISLSDAARQHFTSLEQKSTRKESAAVSRSAMQPQLKFQSRQDHLLSEGSAGQHHLGSSLQCAPDQSMSTCLSCQKESAELSSSMSHRDSHCPVCLQTASFPVQTNCGHLFCAPCLITYWRHGSWLDAISCPLCRQKVSVLCHLFKESRSDRQSKEVLGEITNYNRRYSGAPRRVTDYLCDAPLLLQLLARGLGAMGGLVWLFFFRVALCCVGTVVSIASSSPPPPLDADESSSLASPLETDPSLCGLLGVLDDLVVVVLLLICIVSVNRQMVSEREGHSANPAASQGVVGNSL